MPKALETIAHVTSAAAGALVKSGTTADIYSVNATTHSHGGGPRRRRQLESGVFRHRHRCRARTSFQTKPVTYETVNIRGGDYDQVGYEFDGVPVRVRSITTVPARQLAGQRRSSGLHRRERRRTRKAPVSRASSTRSSRPAPIPGYATGSLGIGTPTFYHRAAVEVGGSTPDRLFSYYVGIGGQNQAFDFINDNNGSEYQNFFGPASGIVPNGAYAKLCLLGSVACFPGGLCKSRKGRFSTRVPSTLYSRNVVVNFHIGIPHHNDAGRDDIQILYDNESLQTQLYQSANDFASPQCTGPAGVSGVGVRNLLVRSAGIPELAPVVVSELRSAARSAARG